MPTLRWLGCSRVMSLPSTMILPADRLFEAGDHAQDRGLAAAGWSEQRDELARLHVRLKPLTTVLAPKDFRTMLDGQEWLGHRFSLDQFGRFADLGAKRASNWIRPMQPQVMVKEITASAAGS